MTEQNLRKILSSNRLGYEEARAHNNTAVANYILGRIQVYEDWINSLTKLNKDETKVQNNADR